MCPECPAILVTRSETLQEHWNAMFLVHWSYGPLDVPAMSRSAFYYQQDIKREVPVFQIRAMQ
jgi:hypothetical protein